MEKLLDSDWWLKDPVDFEHKKWLFLAYLKRLDDAFYALKFSPWLLHSDNLFREMNASYQAILNFNNDLMRDVLVIKDDVFYFTKERPQELCIETFTSILEFSIPLLENKIEFGWKLWRDSPTILW